MDLKTIIVSHGGEALLRRCLRSLEAHPPKGGMSITVVDSGSPDSTPDMVAREFPEVRLLRRDNIGFSAANNLALGESEAEAVLLLNPDTEVYAGTLDAALARLQSEERIGMVGVKLVTDTGELDHACKRSFPSPLSALAHFTGIGRRTDASGALSQYRATHLGDDEPGEVDAVNGAFMLCKAEAVREVGLLDEGYWLYMEDLDWCHRFWDAGWGVFYEPAGVALHVKGGSSGHRRGLRQEIAFHRGMARFYRRFDASEHNRLLNAAVYTGIGVKLAISLTMTAGKRTRPPHEPVRADGIAPERLGPAVDGDVDTGTPSGESIDQAIETLKAAPIREVQDRGYHFQRRDFYSALNDMPFLSANWDLWHDRPSPEGIAWDLDSQLEEVRRISPHMEELADVPFDAPVGPPSYHWANDFWRGGDAMVHYALLRHAKPQRVVEIGCGWSSLLMRDALERNESDGAATAVVNQIEPYPRRELLSALPTHWTLHDVILQRADLSLFESLEAGDVCFYDGSHVARAGSDVVWFFFEVLPRLKPGVLVHLHDICWPADYPDEWIFDRGQTWNEQYVLQAFLMYNSAFEPLICNAMLYHRRKDQVDDLYSVTPETQHTGSSVWLRRTAEEKR